MEILSEWLQLDQSDPLTFEKEVIYADDFEKRDSRGVLEYKFKISPPVLTHLKLSVDEQLKNGVEIPYSSKHAGWELAENRWGDVVGSRVGKNSKNKDALFLSVKFKDEETKTLGLRANVSIGVPPVAFDGLGRKYTNPVRHLAATSAPVIPGLGEWQALAASFESDQFIPIIGDLAMPFPPKNEDPPAPTPTPPAAPAKPAAPAAPPAPAANTPKVSIFDQILQVLELQVPAEADDNAKGTAILTALQMLKGKRAMNQQQTPPTPMQQAAAQGGKPQATSAGGGIQLSNEPSPLILDTIAKNRELQLSQLVHSGSIDPNCAKELETLYASRDQIGLELSQGGDGAQFNRLIEILAKNKPVCPTGRSAGGDLPEGEVQLSHDGKSGLQAVIDKRVKEAEGQH